MFRCYGPFIEEVNLHPPRFGLKVQKEEYAHLARPVEDGGRVLFLGPAFTTGDYASLTVWPMR